MNYFKITFALVILTSCKSEYINSQNYETVSAPTEDIIYPGDNWAYTSPDNFGFSEEKLTQVKAEFESIGGDAFLVVKNGYVIASWGDIAKPIQNRSIRKSYLNALLGMEYDLGNLDLNATMEELGVDDIEGLTAAEKQATIHNLITSSSGVYHPGAYESKEQEGARPPRGSFKPGEFFYYNNWDFNAIGHIYRMISSNDLFVGIENSISNRIGMEDFQLEHTKYEFEESKSKFPAYRMQTSARDDARLGYLYLRKGKWKDEQLLSEEWVSKSFEKHADTGEYRYYDYGLLWWIDTNNKIYIARGNSGQYIAVYPEEDMVFVFRADPGSVLRKWMGLRVKPQESFQLINMILSAKKEI